MLVCVELEDERRDRPGMGADELIEDLEVKLGAALMPYIQVRVSYSRSEAPGNFDNDGNLGLVQTRSNVETTSTLQIRRYSEVSPWRDFSSSAYNPTFAAIVRRVDGGIGPQRQQHDHTAFSCASSDTNGDASYATANSRSARSNSDKDMDVAVPGHGLPVPNTLQKWWPSRRSSLNILGERHGNREYPLRDDGTNKQRSSWNTLVQNDGENRTPGPDRHAQGGRWKLLSWG